MRALVTGHQGFVGRHMTRALLGEGYEVTGIDIAAGDDCRDFFAGSTTGHFDLVVHCAAVVGGRAMIDGEPLALAAEDLSIDAALFRWALRTRPGRIVYFSSSAAYPVAMQQRYSHEALYEEVLSGSMWVDDGLFRGFGMPDQTYGWVKLTGERLAAEANKVGIRTHVFRPFSGYGADQDEAYPFPAIVRRAMVHDPANAFVVWGDPASTRDWVHIDDVVGCVLAAIDADDIGPMNICTGVATDFADLARKALAAVGHFGVPVVGEPGKPAGVFHRVGDPTRMRRVCAPRVTLDEGIERAVAELRR